MAITRINVAQDVLGKLFVVEGSGVPEAEDQATVLDVLNSRVEQLREDGVCWWDNDDIPLQVRDALTDFVAGHAAPFFMTGADLGLYEQRGYQGYITLRRLASNQAEGSATRAEYF